jgi:hypothetical protein
VKLPAWRPSGRFVVSGVDQPREFLQRLGTPHARASRTAEAENVPTRLLELGILERFRLIQRPAVTVVARIEPPPVDESLQSQAFTRHSEER